MIGRWRALALRAVPAAGLAVLSLTSAVASAGARPVEREGVEIPLLRTEFSTTDRLADGTYETKLSAIPLHYRDASGAWRTIDNGLVRQADGSLRNGANSIDVEIPRTADGEVTFDAGGSSSVGFSLRSADDTATAAISGDTARFDGAVGDVDLSYEVVGKALKESLTLPSAAAPAVYRFDVASDGLTPTVASTGEVVFRDARGTRRLAFAAPWMRDADGAISRAASYEIEQTGTTSRIALRLDESWLDAPGRAYPVVVDPTVYSYADHVCEIASGADSSTSLCDGSLQSLWIGRDRDGIVRRGLFDLEDLSEAVPRYAHVLDSWLAVYLDGQTPAGASEIDLHHLTRDFTTRATWNRSDGRALWTRSGGDFNPVREARRSTDAPPPDGWIGLDMTELAQRMVSRAEPSQNLLLKAADETRTHIDSFDSAEVMIRWAHRTGPSGRYAFEQRDLPDGTSFDINVANGNIFLSAHDLDLESDDGRFTVGRYFNSKNLSETSGTFGRGSRGDFGSIKVERGWQDGSYIFFGAGAEDGVFHKQPDGSFVPPVGLPATLTEQPDGTVTIYFADTTELWTFDRAGRLIQTRQDYGYTIDGTYGANGLATLRDSAGHSAVFAYDGAGDMRSITDETSTVFRYDYDGSHRLTTYTAPSGAQTRYVYDGSNRLQKIVFPDRTALKIGYDGSSTDPDCLTPVDAAGVDQPATTIDHQLDHTIVEPPAPTPRTVYFFDPYTLVTDLVQHGSDAALATSGTIPSLDGQYSRGDEPFAVAVAAGQAPDGIQLLELEVDGVEVDAVGDAPCDETTCPRRAADTLRYDASFDPDGTYEFRVNTVDGDDERTLSPTWRVLLDRTPPTAVSDIAFVGIDDDAAEFEWENGEDPAAPDGTPGSGLALALVRYRVGPSGAWSAWADATEESLWVPGLSYGQQVTVEVREVDRVGNEAPVTSETITLTEPDTEDSAFFDVDENGDPVIAPPEETGRAALPTGVCVRGPFRTHKSPYFVSVSDDNPNNPQNVDSVMLQATVIQECINPPMDAQIYEMQLRACVRMIGKDGEPHNQVCDKRVERARAGEFFRRNQVRLDINLLCRPGTRTYKIRTYTRVKQTPAGTRAKRVRPSAANFHEDARNCDETNAWIYQATHTPAAGPSAPDGWRTYSDVRTWSSPSAYLRTRMGDPPTTSGGWAAHHIVAARGWLNRRADRSQAAAYMCGIDPNGPTNGAWLRGPDLADGTRAWNALRPTQLRERAYHPRIHTTAYFIALANRLEPLVTAWPEDCRATMREKLNNITNNLYKNAFPYRPADREPLWTDD